MSGILIDFDSTLNQFDQHLLDAINAKFGTFYEVREWTYWAFPRAGEGMTQEEADFAWGVELFKNRDWTLTIPPAPGAVLATNRLLDAGFDVHVVSARFKYMRRWIKQWLEQNGIYSKTGDGDLAVATHSDKKGYARAYDIGVAIEDAPHNAIDLSAVCPVYLIDQPWNRNVIEGGPITRVESVWEAVEDLLSGN